MVRANDKFICYLSVGVCISQGTNTPKPFDFPLANFEQEVDTGQYMSCDRSAWASAQCD